MADISSITLPDGSQYYFKDTVARAQGMVVLTYGTSTYAECLAAYKANKLVYCRVDKRMAFLAYVNNGTTPTEFEFQYYRSVSSHTDAQQGDQVFVYKLNSSGTWSTTTREAYTKVIAGTNITSTYASGAITLSLASAYGDTQNPYDSKTANYILAAPDGSNGAPTFRALVAADLPTVPTTKGGTGLISIGTAGQVLKVNSGATALEWGEAASSVSSTSSKMVITTVPNVTSVGSAPTLGTAIDADDITAWNAGSTPTLGTAIDADDITAWSAGAAPTLGTAIDADDITAWSAGSATTAAVADGVLTITAGTAPSLSYTARSIPNVTDVGSAPSLSYTARSIPNVTSVGSAPSLTYTARSIPNVTSVGSAPTLGTAITVATGSLDDNASGATVVTSVSSS